MAMLEFGVPHIVVATGDVLAPAITAHAVCAGHRYAEELDGPSEPPVNVGFYAHNALRMEKAYKARGVELTVKITAWERGLD